MTSESDRDSAPTARSDGAEDTGVFVAETDAERDDAFTVRRSVFVDEQGVDPGIEYDEYDEPDADATHFVAYADGEPIGAARLRPAGEAASAEPVDGPVGKVERVAVAADSRGDGWGRRLMDAVEARAREEGFDELTLHAQTHVREFYERLRYEAYGAEFEEAGIPHVAMEKELDGDA
ncbi:GNAT family N-acetyltransferase [Halobellus ruber]|uniref:GNAT family N-acetyltransferase n=1 Tax=Halobellus ruber TaxID=2761102 RepID=A0A7J9SGR4_9EURY|nr:GNAT family N-acetyltransferase [Halobellus ruber]